MNIIIHPYSNCLQSGKENAKNYPFWQELVSLLESDGHDLLQIGVHGEKQLVKDFRPNLSDQQHLEMLNFADTFICIDSWYQHFVSCMVKEGKTYPKKGIVLWGVSNPRIFGYPENFNLYVDKKYFRPDQFQVWHDVEHNPKAFVKPDFVMEKLRAWIESEQERKGKILDGFLGKFAGNKNPPPSRFVDDEAERKELLRVTPIAKSLGKTPQQYLQDKADSEALQRIYEQFEYED